MVPGDLLHLQKKPSPSIFLHRCMHLFRNNNGTICYVEMYSLLSVGPTFIGEGDIHFHLRKCESKAHFLPKKWETRAFPWASESETHSRLTYEWIRKKRFS